MKEIDIIICLKKKNKDHKNIKKVIASLKNRIFFLHCIKMRKELIFNNGYNNYSMDMYYFQTDKKNPININEVDINKIFLSNRAPYGEQGSYK